MSVVAPERGADLRTAPRVLPASPTRLLVASRASALAPYLSRQLQSVGRAGIAGLGLLVLAIAFFFGANSPLQSELAGLQSTLDNAAADPARPQANTARTPQTELLAFVKNLPPRSELPALTVRIAAQATTAGIALERGTYEIALTGSGQLVRARMSFPVHGRYPEIRSFIDGTLAAIPGAAVDALRFSRKNVGDAEIDADVRFAIYLRAGS